MSKKFKVTVLVNNPVYVEYLVDAENEEDAKENYGGFPVIDEEPYLGSEDEVVSVEEVKENDDEENTPSWFTVR